jgi:hypothetical protein
MSSLIRWAAGVALLAVALLFPAPLAGAAPAAVSGVQVVTATSPSASPSVAVTAVSCPAGKQLINIGANVLGVDGQVRIDAMRPNSLTNPTRATVVAREDETGVSANWAVTARATCANPIAGLRVFTARRTVRRWSVPARRSTPGPDRWV